MRQHESPAEDKHVGDAEGHQEDTCEERAAIGRQTVTSEGVEQRPDDQCSEKTGNHPLHGKEHYAGYLLTCRWRAKKRGEVCLCIGHRDHRFTPCLKPRYNLILPVGAVPKYEVKHEVKYVTFRYITQAHV